MKYVIEIDTQNENPTLAKLSDVIRACNAEDDLKETYFTYGTSPTQPYRCGWTRIITSKDIDPYEVFMKHHPPIDSEDPLLNCATSYTKEQFTATSMYKKNDNMGASEHELIIAVSDYNEPEIKEDPINTALIDRVTEEYRSKNYELHRQILCRDEAIKDLNQNIEDLRDVIYHLKFEHEPIDRDKKANRKWVRTGSGENKRLDFYCPQCGARVSNWESYCNYCGQALGSGNPEPEDELQPDDPLIRV